MANVFSFTITAVDKATAVMRGVNTSVDKLVNPIVKVQASAKSLAKEAASNQLIKAFNGVSKSIGGAARSASSFIPEIAPLAELGAAGGVLGGLVAMAAALGVLTYKWSYWGFAVKQTAVNLDMTNRQVQAWRGGAAQFGISAQSMDQNMTSLGDTMEDAFYGRNQTALITMNRLGISMKRLKDGSPDVQSALYGVADAMKRMNPAQQRLAARNLGLDPALLPMLRQGSAAMKAYNADIAKYALSDKEVDAADHLAMTINKWKTIAGLLLYRIPGNFWAGFAAIGGLFTTTTGKIGAALGTIQGSFGDWKRGMGVIGAFFIQLWNDIAGAFERGLARIKAVIDKAKAMIPGLGDLAGKAADQALGAGRAAADAAGGWAATQGQAIAGVLGIKRNNPGNLRPVGGAGFRSFDTLTQGVVAMARQLQLYSDRHGLKTIAGIVNRWAPAADHNPTAAYIAHVAKWTGWSPSQVLNLHDPKTLASLEAAMIRQEQGRAALTTDQVLAAIGAKGGAQAAPAAAGANGAVAVDVRVRHDGHRATTRVRGSGAVTTTARVERSMPQVTA